MTSVLLASVLTVALLSAWVARLALKNRLLQKSLHAREMPSSLVKSAESALRAALTAMPHAVLLLDSAGGILWANPVAKQLFGCPQQPPFPMLEACLAEPCAVAIKKLLAAGPAALADSGKARLDAAVASLDPHSDINTTLTLDYLPLAADVGQYLLQVQRKQNRSADHVEADGRGAGVASDNRGSQSDLAQKYDRLRFALDNLKVGVWEYQIQEDRLIWDDQMYQIYGLNKAEFGENFESWAAALLPDDFESATQLLHKCIDRKAPFKTTFRVPHHEGSTRVISADADILHDASGRARAMIGTNVDITEKHALEQAHQRALEETKVLAMQRAAFMATMSHELRTPLNGILGVLELLLQSSLSPEQRNKVRIAQKSADALLTLFHDLLEVSTLNAGELQFVERPFDLQHFFGDFAQSMAFTVEEKGLNLVLDAADLKHANVLGDVDRLRQLLTNLFSNAQKFTADGDIVLQCGSELIADRVQVTFSLTDTGVGIEPDVLAHLFDPFYQADSSPTREYGGAGLGLAVCKKLCDAMGGSITVESTPGQGATFQVHFSVASDPNPAQSESVADEPKINTGEAALSHFKGRRLLVSLSHPATRSAVGRQLRRWGALIASTATGDEAIRAIGVNKTSGSISSDFDFFDAVLVDRYLDDVTGPELVQRLRQQGMPASVPVILCGALSDRVDDRVLAEWGFKGYVPKPVAPRQLSIILEQVLSPASLEPAVLAADNAEQCPAIECPFNEQSECASPRINALPIIPSINVDSACPSDGHDAARVEAHVDNSRAGQGSSGGEGQTLECWMEALRSRTDLQVLIVEDNEVNQEIVLLFLEEINLTASVAANGHEALSHLLTASATGKPVDVIFMDCQMPEMDGYEATRAIRAGEAGDDNREVPIIALTANALSGDREKCLEAGMNDYLSKPVEVEDFYARLGHWSGLCCDLQLLKIPDDVGETAIGLENISGGAVAKNDALEPAAPPWQKEPARTASDNCAVWDQAAALAFLGSEHILEQLVRVFFERKSEHLQRILSYFEHGDYQALARCMQALKGSAAQLMASELVVHAETVRVAAEAGNLAECEALRPEFIRSFEKLELALEAYLAPLNAVDEDAWHYNGKGQAPNASAGEG